MTRQLVTLRLPEDLLEWLEPYVEKNKRTELVESLLTAMRDRRLLIALEPAPHTVNNGTRENYPVLVCLNPE